MDDEPQLRTRIFMGGFGGGVSVAADGAPTPDRSRRSGDRRVAHTHARFPAEEPPARLATEPPLTHEVAKQWARLVLLLPECFVQVLHPAEHLVEPHAI